MLLYGQNEYVTAWVADRLEYAEPPPAYSAIGCLDEDLNLKAGAYFDGYTGTNLFAHIASTSEILPHTLLRAIADYAFVQLGCRRMTLMVAADNYKCKTMVEGLGAVREAVIEDGHPGGDVYLYALRPTSSFIKKLVDSGRLLACGE